MQPIESCIQKIHQNGKFICFHGKITEYSPLFLGLVSSMQRLIGSSGSSQEL